MADQTIDQFPAITELADTHLLPVKTPGGTNKITVADAKAGLALVSSVNGAAGAVVLSAASVGADATGTAAAAVAAAASGYATAAQGAKADSALQVTGTPVVGHVPTVTSESPLTVEYAAPAGGGGGASMPAQPTPTYTDNGTPYVSVPGVATTSRLGAVSIPANEYRLFPIVVFAPITITEARIGVESAGTAGTNCRIAIYEIDNADGKPAALAADIGVVSIAATGQKRLTGLSVPLATGMYLVRVHNQSTASLTYWGGYTPWWSAGPLGNNNNGIAMTGGGLTYAAAEDPGNKPSTAFGAITNSSLFVLAQFVWTVD